MVHLSLAPSHDFGDAGGPTFGASQDSRIIYDGANDEFTIQTKSAAGVLTDRFTIDGNTDAPTAKFNTFLGVLNTLDATSVSVASFSTAGGAGIAKKLLTGGSIFIGETANASMTLGLTINIAGNDDEAFAIKSSDVAHGLTGQAETDTFLHIGKSGLTSTGGGATFQAFSDSDISTTPTLQLGASAGANADTTKTTAARGMIETFSRQHDGANNLADVVANGNIVVFRGQTGSALPAKFIFDIEGSAHADVEFTTFDAEDDIALLRDIEAAMIPNKFGETLKYHRADMERLGIIGKDSWHERDGKTHAMVNMTRLAMLHHGAIQQVFGYVKQLEGRLKMAGIALPEAS